MPSKKKTAKKTKADDDVKVVVDDDALEENENAKGCGGTPAPQKLPQITVARLLNETQLGVSMHKRMQGGGSFLLSSGFSSRPR